MSMKAILGLALLGGFQASGYQMSVGQHSPLRQHEAGSDPLPKGSQGEEPWPLYPAGRIPGTKIKDIPAESFYRADPFNAIGIMCTPGGRAAGNYYYDIAEPTLVPYLVNKSAPNRRDVAVVVAPGGGNEHLAFEVTGLDVAGWLNSLGISAFVLKYRVPASNWAESDKVAMMDGQRALSMARERSTALGLGFKQIGLFGASAGGKLATQLATASSRSYPRVDAVDDLSFVPDFMLLLYPAVPKEAMSGAGRVPSTFISMASGDPCVSSSEVVKFFQEMKKQGAPSSELHVYKDQKHGYGTCNMYPSYKDHPSCQWTGEAQRFLDTYLDGPGLNVTVTQLTTSTGSVWCPPANGCKPKSACVGHCAAACWAQC